MMGAYGNALWSIRMCRLLLYVFKGGSTFWDKVIDSFYFASTNDTILWELTGKKSHNHGWGYVIYRFSNNKAFLSYYKTSTPIGDDVEGINLLKNFGELTSKAQMLIMHSRLTGEREVKNLENTHPYMEHVPGKFTLWLAHNGRVSKVNLAREVGLENYLRQYSDTYFLTKYLARKIPMLANKRDILYVLKEIIDKGYVVSALNVVALIIFSDEKVYGFALNYIAPEVSQREEYYRLYMISLGDNEKIVASSTFTKYFRNGEFKGLNNGDVVFFKLANGELSFSLNNLFRM